MKYKIGIISQYYTPEPTPIPEDLAIFLTHHGHYVEVFTSFPQYPAGKLYNGYTAQNGVVEYVKGIKVHRYKAHTSPKKSFFHRALTFLSFSLSLFSAVNTIYRQDVLYVYGSPLTNAIIPKILKIFRGPPYIIHAVDIWPESLLSELEKVRAGSFRRAISAVLSTFSNSLYKSASGIVAVSNHNLSLLTSKLQTTKLSLALNSSTIEFESAGNSPRIQGNNSVTRFCYGGNIGKMQDLGLLVDAVKVANDEGALFELVIAGDGVLLEEIRLKVSKLAISNIEFQGRISTEEMISLYKQSDFGISTLIDSPIFSGSIPSKVPAMLSQGLPIISNIPGETKELIEKFKIGYTAIPADVYSLANALIDASNISPIEQRKLIKRARRTYLTKMSRSKSLAVIEKMLAESVRSSELFRGNV